MTEQTDNQKDYKKQYVSTGEGGYYGGRSNRNRRSGFLPGMLVGILVTSIVVGILFVMTGGSSSQTGMLPAGGAAADSAVNEESINKLSVLEQYMDYYYYKSSEITQEEKETGIYKGLFESLGDVYSCYNTPEEYKVLTEQPQGVY